MPKRLKLLSDIPRGLVAWDANYRAFKDGGGAKLTDAGEVGALMRLLPDEIKQKAVWEWDKFEGQPFELRKWVRARTKLLVNWDLASHKGIHALDEPQQGTAEEPDLEELCSFLPHLSKGGSATKEELHAFGRKKLTGQANARKPGGGGQAAERRPAREAPARDARDAKCPNCGKTGHTKEDCKSAKVDLNARPCWTCGELGHVSARCPKKQAGQARALQGEAVPPVLDFNLFETVMPSSKKVN